ncbi:MAG: patatin-like phospholipase family protein, partial [Candidatus Acidiferrales bacterium]
PGLFPPVEHEGRMLADGCIVSPVPTAIAAQMRSLCVLGVAVSSDTKSQACVTGRRSERRVGAPQCAWMAQPSWCRHADLLLEPEVDQISWDDFQSVDEAYDAGVAVMRRAVPFVRGLLNRRTEALQSVDSAGEAQSEMVS